MDHRRRQDRCSAAVGAVLAGVAAGCVLFAGCGKEKPAGEVKPAPRPAVERVSPALSGPRPTPTVRSGEFILGGKLTSLGGFTLRPAGAAEDGTPLFHLSNGDQAEIRVAFTVPIVGAKSLLDSSGKHALLETAEADVALDAPNRIETEDYVYVPQRIGIFFLTVSESRVQMILNGVCFVLAKPSGQQAPDPISVSAELYADVVSAEAEADADADAQTGE